MSEPDVEHPQVRFSSENQEIEPEASLQPVETLSSPGRRDDLTPETRQELRGLAVTMQKTRMENFNYEPVSLPASRVSCAVIFPRSMA